ncbi:tRNA dihydrouridine synthase DusB [Paludicola sp. MB14-C6]|uniref:tRNA dihydrouridine synthase DusB n=1 Tax=Paludihabitans sp. MB14-C6 TaxID=3070656 RepID=UPI0027DAFFB9|nr:tRNA dihydrouridine synthase DusB [Paludicola sp. MB14-C6]WMJ22362.1 tRNA dihydrouridine synthase DusB [Paludicola sp. MB14-C6]
MLETIKIGNVTIDKTACLAPMASVADRAYRYMCKKYGASYVIGEMASAKGLCYSDRKSNELLEVTKYEYPMAVQLFGDSPEFMAKAAVIASKYKPQIIDVNMGCPVPKVAGNGCGSALMKTPELAAELVHAMTKVTDIPITVKIRKGWDDESVNAVPFAKMMEQAGASAITIHGRTKQQMYHPPIDLDIIKAVKQAISIPVIGNGGIVTAIDAKHMYDYTGCDLVMVGQGTYGRPWIFQQIKTYLETGESLSEPSINERLDVMYEHISLIVKLKGEKMGMREARKHAAWYIKGSNGAAGFRHACGQLSTLDDLRDLIQEVKKRI